MQHPPGWRRLQRQLRGELRQLTTLQASDRRWPMPFAAALASGLPLLVGAYFARMDYGLIASLGGIGYAIVSQLLQRRTITTIAFGPWLALGSMINLGYLAWISY